MDDQSSFQPPSDPDAKSALPAGAVDLALTDAAQVVSELSTELGVEPTAPETQTPPQSTVLIEQRAGKIDAQLDAIDEMLSSIVQDVGDEVCDDAAGANEPAQAAPTNDATQTPDTKPTDDLDDDADDDVDTVASAPDAPASRKVISLPPAKPVGLPAKHGPPADEPDEELAETVGLDKPAAKPLPPITPNKPPTAVQTDAGGAAKSVSEAPSESSTDASQSGSSATEISQEEWEQFDDTDLPALDDGSGSTSPNVAMPPVVLSDRPKEAAPELSEARKCPPLLVRRALVSVADALDMVDRPFVRLGDRVRSLLGWAAIMLLFAAACIILTLQFI